MKMSLLRAPRLFGAGVKSLDGKCDRLRRAGLTGTTNIVAQGINIAVTLISVPLTVPYLGIERYGLWLTIGSLLAWLTVADLGLKNSLVNALAEANGLDNRQMASEAVSTAFWVQVGLVAVFGLIAALAIPHINWHKVFNVSQQVSTQELRWGVGVFLACFLLSLPTGIVPAIYLGYQEGYIANLWLTVGSLLSLLALVLVTRFEGGLPQLILAVSGIRVVVTIVNGIYLVFKEKSWLRPKFRAIRLGSLKRLLATGSMYMVAQLSGAGIFSSQALIISQISGPAQVGPFGIAYKLLTLPMMVTMLLTGPLLPAYGEAQARGDWNWIRQVLKKTLKITLTCLGPALLVLGFWAQPIIRLWAGTVMVPETSIVVWLSLYTLIVCIAQIFSVVIFGLERVRAQALVSSLTAIITVGFGISLTRISGPTGMAQAMTLAILGNAIVVAIICLKLVKNKSYVAEA